MAVRHCTQRARRWRWRVMGVLGAHARTHGANYRQAGRRVGGCGEGGKLLACHAALHGASCGQHMHMVWYGTVLCGKVQACMRTVDTTCGHPFIHPFIHLWVAHGMAWNRAHQPASPAQAGLGEESIGRRICIYMWVWVCFGFKPEGHAVMCHPSMGRSGPVQCSALQQLPSASWLKRIHPTCTRTCADAAAAPGLPLPSPAPAARRWRRTRRR